MRCSLWSENVNSTTFSWRIPIDNPVSIPVVRPESNTGAPSWWLTPGFNFRGWSQGEASDYVARRWLNVSFPYTRFLPSPLPNLSLRLITAHGANSRNSHVAVFLLQVTGVEFLALLILSIYFRQTVQWSMILESSISNGVVCWIESFTLVISSIKLTTRWMFCKTRLIICELTAGKTNGCSVVTY